MTTAVNKFFNSANGSQDSFILCSEFLRYRIRVLILRNNNYPLIGDVTTSELWEMARESFPGNEDDFHAETKKALSGKGKDYKFYMEETMLKWELGLWTRGSIKLFAEADIINFSDVILTTLEGFIKNQLISSSVDEENKKLLDENESFKCQLEEMLKLKDLEKHMLTKFILILNEKKKHIRELVREIEMLKEKYEPSPYQLSTDEEMSDDENKMNVTCSPKPSTSNVFHDSSLVKTESETSFEFTPSEEMKIEENKFINSPKPSTSNEFNKLKKELTPNKNIELEENETLSIPIRRRGSIMDDEFEDIVNNVVNSVPEKISYRSAIKSRKCLFDESDEEIELKYDSLTQ
ncbi:uncharacterized protein LOC127276762 [Leptopilina boulardi]|uniref:uncharacterized protein LOC127276762 n=1 Tax=Leptopilina boulardi TaxID=63433 RepID=UPI0021F5DBED|nr:uncharacterized protein LOC127276762 [Leptopilina boulardi]XP_051153365.1 uncharacterized protein LOC127276762 [Leptopilina boulardi]XP_051153366.1 uncharacterized protein LOC127276762 [Leptopilina boulardi]